MSTPDLNVALVESLQKALQRGKSVDFLNCLESTTLAGLLEYHCLSVSNPAFGLRLPLAIRQSQLARAFDSLRITGTGESLTTWRSTATKTLAVQNVEFAALPADEQMLDQVEWETFFGRFERSTKSVGFNDQCFPLVEDTKLPIRSIKVIGSIDDYLKETLESISEAEAATGAQLARLQPNIQATAWNNRLKELHDKRLLVRRKEGRQQIYSPLAGEVKFDG